MGRKDHVEIEDCKLLNETDRAVLVEKDGYQEWIPKSLLESHDLGFSVGETGSVWVEQWKVEEMGWDFNG